MAAYRSRRARRLSAGAALIRLTLPHYFDFGEDAVGIGRDLLSREAWDAARDTAGPFGLPGTREAWEQGADRPDLRARADEVARVAERLGARTLCSYGVGVGHLELALSRRLPGVRLTCTDFAPRAVERLSRFFAEAEVRLHDLLRDEPLDADLHLLHRLDTELSNADWRRVLPRFRTPALFVPTPPLTAGRALKELARRLGSPRATRAGWVRTEAALRALWRESHDHESLTVGGEAAFLLLPRQPATDRRASAT